MVKKKFRYTSFKEFPMQQLLSREIDRESFASCLLPLSCIGIKFVSFHEFWKQEHCKYLLKIKHRSLRKESEQPFSNI